MNIVMNIAAIATVNRKDCLLEPKPIGKGPIKPKKPHSVFVFELDLDVFKIEPMITNPESNQDHNDSYSDKMIVHI